MTNDIQVSRENLVQLIDSLFLNGNKAVSLEGQPGIGKSNIAKLFHHKHQESSLPIFLSNNGRWGADPILIQRQICDHALAIMKTKTLNHNDHVDEAVLRTLIYELQKYLRRMNLTAYFIVDGLSNIPSSQSTLRQAIVDLLPIGLDCSNMKFLFTAIQKDDLTSLIGKDIQSLPIPFFELRDSIEFFSNMDIEREIVTELHRITKGIPERLVSAKRMMSSGTSIDDITDKNQRSQHLLELEWKSITPASELGMKLVSLLAHGSRDYSINDISRVLGAPEAEIIKELRLHTFLSITEENIAIFASETFRQFAIMRTAEFKAQTLNSIIADLMNTPMDTKAASTLPRYLREAGRLDDLITLLSTDRLEKAMDLTKSLLPIKEQVDFGVAAAFQLGKDRDLVRFALSKSVLDNDDGAHSYAAEATAHLSLKDYAGALSLAHSLTLKEDRLRVLALIAKAMHEDKTTITPELSSEISTLSNSINPTNLSKEYIISVASCLLSISAELAISLIERARNRNGDNGSDTDLAFASLSLEVIEKKTNSDRESFEQLHSKISDPDLRTFTNSAGMIYQNYSATMILAEVSTIANPRQQMFILRVWCMKNDTNAEALRVVSHALSMAISSRSYTPNARDLRHICTPLRHINNKDELMALIESIDSLKAAVQPISSSVEYVRLLLILAEIEFKYNEPRAITRVQDAYIFSHNVVDLGNKCECFAHLISRLSVIDPARRMDEKVQIHTKCGDDFSAILSELLLESASHFEAVKGCITALAVTHWNRAVDIAVSLNTEPRRDLALSEIIITYINNPRRDLAPEILFKVLSRISDLGLASTVLWRYLDWIVKKQPTKTPREIVQKLFEHCEKIPRAFLRAQCLSALLKISHDSQYDLSDELNSRILQKLWSTYDISDGATERILLAFRIVPNLAEVSKDESMKFLKRAEADRAALDSTNCNLPESFTLCTRLVIASFAGLLNQRLETAQDIAHIKRLISAHPSNEDQAYLWNDLIERCYLENREDLCKEIVETHLRRNIDAIPAEDSGLRNRVVAHVASGLYVGGPIIANEYLKALSAFHFDDACDVICDFLIFKVPSYEPNDDTAVLKNQKSYSDIIFILNVLERCGRDASICNYVEKIVDIICDKGATQWFTNPEKAQIIGRMEKIVEENLPTSRFIKHEGFKLLALAQILKAKKERSKERWQALFDRAVLLPNKSDRTFTLAGIGEANISKDDDLTGQCFLQSRSIAEQLKIAPERIDRLLNLARDAYGRNMRISKEIVKSVTSYSKCLDGERYAATQRRIADLAYRIDKDFAVSLASVIDDDPSKRKQGSRPLKDQLKLLSCRESIIGNKPEEPKDDWRDRELTPKECAQLCWMSLSSLNSGRIAPMPLASLRDFAQQAAKLPLSDALPIILWIVSNAKLRFKDKTQALTILRPLFEDMLHTCHLSMKFFTRIERRFEPSVYAFEAGSPSEQLHAVEPMSHELVVKSLEQWLEECSDSYLKICDPYWNADDLWILNSVLKIKPNLQVHILTSFKAIEQNSLGADIEEGFLRHWRDKYSDQSPPSCLVTLVELRNVKREFPIHDRWWLSKSTGLNIGTSIGSLGGRRYFGLYPLSLAESKKHECHLDQFLSNKQMQHLGERLRYMSFSL